MMSSMRKILWAAFLLTGCKGCGTATKHKVVETKVVCDGPDCRRGYAYQNAAGDWLWYWMLWNNTTSTPVYSSSSAVWTKGPSPDEVEAELEPAPMEIVVDEPAEEPASYEDAPETVSEGSEDGNSYSGDDGTSGDFGGGGGDGSGD
jgi:hypothetical protein